MSKIIYLIIAVLILGGGFFLVKKTYLNDSKSNNAQTQEKTVVPVATDKIAYDGTAFSPAAIEVKVGDTVTFTNKGAAGMWVASGPHPTHTIYPEFDAKKAYNPNEAYTFTFDKAGTWKYHNHMNPTAFGSVTVK